MKRAFKYSLLGVFVLFLIVSGYIIATNWLLINPNGKFPYYFEYKEFTIRSDEPIEKQIKQKLDSVSWRLTSVLDYQNDSYQIYLCNSPKTYGLFSNKVGKPQKTQGFNLQPLNHIFINISFVHEMRSRNYAGFKYHILEGNLSHLLAHEICHQLIAEQIGFFRMRRIDSWKLEGFCEYSASKRMKTTDPSYRFSEFAANYFNGRFDDISTGRKFYIESMIMVEYYLDYKNKNFIDLVNDDISKEILLQEIIRKNQENSLTVKQTTLTDIPSCIFGL